MDPISVNVLNLVGRVTERDKALGNVFAIYNADYSSAAAYAFQFGVQSQGQTFGVVRSIKVDNGSNPENIEVAVSGTDDYFTIPAFSIGVYTLNANAGSTVTLTSQGGATDICTITFYNYEVPPAVWYSFGAFNSDRPIRAQGAMEEGDTVATEQFNKPIYIGGIDRATGEFRGVGVDALGRLDFSSTINVGGVFGADPMGGAPINPGFAQAVLNSSGDLTYVQLTAGGDFKVNDAALVTLVTASNVALAGIDTSVDLVKTAVDAVDTSIDAFAAQEAGPTAGAITSVASSVGDVTILAANASRKGASIYNNSTSDLRIALANVNATVSYSLVIAAGGTFLINNGEYRGVIKGTWITANGSAIVTENV
jgi:hypothetical protein